MERFASMKETQEETANRRKLAYGRTSVYRGVHWKSNSQKWQATIYPSGRGLYLGLFEIEKDAAIAYDTAARKFFGKSAKLNSPI